MVASLGLPPSTRDRLPCEPIDFDADYDVSARTDKDLAAWWYLERDPERVALPDELLNAAIMEAL
jgi:hypothetical protein